jgi:hypothetical protein
MSTHRFAPAVRAAFWMSGALVSFMTMAIAGRCDPLDKETLNLRRKGAKTQREVNTKRTDNTIRTPEVRRILS